MRHAVSVALQSFEGGMVIVSHDRHLIKTVADTLWLVADGKLEVFQGTWTTTSKACGRAPRPARAAKNAAPKRAQQEAAPGRPYRNRAAASARCAVNSRRSRGALARLQRNKR